MASTFTDIFERLRAALHAPASAGEAADISSTDHTFANVTRAIYVASTGDLIVRLKGNTGNLTFEDVPAGTVLPIRAAKVIKTGTTITTANHIIGIW